MDESKPKPKVRGERSINIYVRPMTETEYSEVVRLFVSRFENQESKTKEVT